MVKCSELRALYELKTVSIGKIKLQLARATARSFGMFSILYLVRRVVWILTCTG